MRSRAKWLVAQWQLEYQAIYKQDAFIISVFAISTLLTLHTVHDLNMLSSQMEIRLSKWLVFSVGPDTNYSYLKRNANVP